MLVALSIAGFDPSGGAGVLADIKTFAAFNCFGTAAITSLTSQNTVAVYGASHQSADNLRMQIQPIISDFKIAAVKTGMLPSYETIEVTAEAIEKHKLPNAVIDPVIRSTSGYDLIDQAAMNHLINRLFPLANLITPNMEEAARLSGLEVHDLAGMKRAAKEIFDLARSNPSKLDDATSFRAVLVKGGHLPEQATDVLYTGNDFHLFRSSKIATRNTHGTGCTLSSAIAAQLAHGSDLLTAVARAKRYLEAALLSAPNIGHGTGPLNHAVNAFMESK